MGVQAVYVHTQADVFIGIRTDEGELAEVPIEEGDEESKLIRGPLWMLTGERAARVPEDRAVRARLAANEFIAILQEHEEQEHGGEACLDERAGVAAFVMHAVGLTVMSLPAVFEALAEYEGHHHA